MKVKIEELSAALAEIKARGKSDMVDIEIVDNRLCVSGQDLSENKLEAILYNEGLLGAHFRMTRRLMFMKDKERP